MKIWRVIYGKLLCVVESEFVHSTTIVGEEKHHDFFVFFFYWNCSFTDPLADREILHKFAFIMRYSKNCLNRSADEKKLEINL